MSRVRFALPGRVRSFPRAPAGPKVTSAVAPWKTITQLEWRAPTVVARPLRSPSKANRAIAEARPASARNNGLPTLGPNFAAAVDPGARHRCSGRYVLLEKLTFHVHACRDDPMGISWTPKADVHDALAATPCRFRELDRTLQRGSPGVQVAHAMASRRCIVSDISQEGRVPRSAYGRARAEADRKVLSRRTSASKQDRQLAEFYHKSVGKSSTHSGPDWENVMAIRVPCGSRWRRVTSSHPS